MTQLLTMTTTHKFPSRVVADVHAQPVEQGLQRVVHNLQGILAASHIVAVLFPGG